MIKLPNQIESPLVSAFLFPTTDQVIDAVVPILKLIFSWIVLMPVAVIVSGQFLGQPLKMQLDKDQRFVIPLRIFRLEAINSQVTLGFAGFIITLLAIGFSGGLRAYIMFRNQFGIDPGQFNSLCILSSFVTVMWSSALWLIVLLINKVKRASPDPVSQKRDELINELWKKFINENRL